MISTNGMLNFLKSKLKNPTDENVLKAMKKIAEPDAEQEKLTENGELPWGWHTANKDFTDKIKNEYTYFLNEWIKSEKSSPTDQYNALKSLVLYLHDAKELCYSKNECFAYWFDGVIADNDYIQKREKELEELQGKYLQLQKTYEKRQKALVGLDIKVVDLLKENQGILQADFVKMFEPEVQGDVSEILYNMAKNGNVTRTKQGRSYTLNINDVY